MFLGHWQFFKDFFKVAFMRYLLFSFAIVPIFVKLLSGVPEKLTIPGTGHFLTFSLPFTWWLLWLASLSYFSRSFCFMPFVLNSSNDIRRSMSTKLMGIPHDG